MASDISPDEFALIVDTYPGRWTENTKDLSPVEKKLKVKGSIYWDHSKKGVNSFGSPKYHNAFRATVTYNGKTYRKRSVDRHDCERFLEKLAKLFAEGEL